MAGSKSEKSKTPAADWKRDAIGAFKAIALRLIDREHGATLLMFTFLVIVLVVVVRIPASALGRIPDAVILLVNHPNVMIGVLFLTCGILVMACVLLLGVLRLQKRVASAEIERMAEQKRLLEERLDPNRPHLLPPPVSQAAPVSAAKASTSATPAPTTKKGGKPS